jgi:predicted Zn-dependent protease
MQVALPGGFFYVHTGLILSGDDESELAGVMARMRSRTLRRATRRSKRRRPQYEAKP